MDPEKLVGAFGCSQRGVWNRMRGWGRTLCVDARFCQEEEKHLEGQESSRGPDSRPRMGEVWQLVCRGALGPWGAGSVEEGERGGETE